MCIYICIDLVHIPITVYCMLYICYIHILYAIYTDVAGQDSNMIIQIPTGRGPSPWFRR